MLTNRSHNLPVTSITIRPDRQRQELRGLEDLAASMARIGLINPIVVTPAGVLVAGERRLTAAKQLGWSHIPVHYTDEISEIEAQVIEFEENAKRLDLTWRETVNAVARYHKLKLEMEGEAWTQEATAEALSCSQSYVNSCLQVFEASEAGNPLVLAADTFTTAKNILARARQRSEALAAETVDTAVAQMFSKPLSLNVPEGTARTAAQAAPAPALAPDAPAAAPFLHTTFESFLSSPPATRFNFLHCDFPYGIGYDKFNQGSAGIYGGYADTKEVYFQCLATLEQAMSTHVAESAHLMFWFSPLYFVETKQALTDMGWRVYDYPLIWHRSCNSGVMPDPKRGPRQVYEMAFHCSRGDRFIVQGVSNFFAAPKPVGIHASEKPVEMLRHFFRLYVDESTIMLDPTCGSGNAVTEALRAGARSAVGLERDEGFYADACLRWRQQQMEG